MADAADVLAQHRPADQGADPGRAAARADAPLGQQLSPHLRTCSSNLGPLITVVADRAARRVTRRSSRARRRPRCSTSSGRSSSSSTRSSRWLSRPPAADLGLHLRRRRRVFAAHHASFGGNGIGHYLRQFGPTGAETLSFAPNRDSNNRGNTYPSPLWLAQVFNAGGKFPGDSPRVGLQEHRRRAATLGSVSSPPASEQACWVAAAPAGRPAVKIPHDPRRRTRASRRGVAAASASRRAGARRGGGSAEPLPAGRSASADRRGRRARARYAAATAAALSPLSPSKPVEQRAGELLVAGDLESGAVALGRERPDPRRRAPGNARVGAIGRTAPRRSPSPAGSVNA